MQNPKYSHDIKFTVLIVSDHEAEENPRMSEFVRNMGKKFEIGRAYYEYSESDDEDLSYYKEVVFVQNSKEV